MRKARGRRHCENNRMEQEKPLWPPARQNRPQVRIRAQTGFDKEAGLTAVHRILSSPHPPAASSRSRPVCIFFKSNQIFPCCTIRACPPWEGIVQRRPKVKIKKQRPPVKTDGLNERLLIV